MVDSAQQRDLLVEPLGSFTSHLVSSGGERQLALAKSPSRQLSGLMRVCNPGQCPVGDAEQDHRYRVGGMVHGAGYVPRIPRAETAERLGLPQLLWRVCRDQTLMHSA